MHKMLMQTCFMIYEILRFFSWTHNAQIFYFYHQPQRDSFLPFTKNAFFVEFLIIHSKRVSMINSNMLHDEKVEFDE